MNYTIRYIAKFLVETATPLSVGTGEKDIELDKLVIKDANGLPYIPGTSLAGVIRHEVSELGKYQEDLIDKIFGYQKGANGQGSRISFSPATLIAKDGKTALEGLQNLDYSKGYYSFFEKLPERDHVRINSKGSADAKGHGKYDEQLVHKGTRFAFEIELIGTEEEEEIWNYILQLVHQPFFRIGAGTRKGFGKLEIKNCWAKTFDLTSEKGMLDYLAKPASLNYDCSDWSKLNPEKLINEKWLHYNVKIKPENFFLFGAGFGDEDVDMAPKKERYFEWSKNGEPKLGEAQEYTLIPATSVKGALSHRTAFHYNYLQGIKIENCISVEKVDYHILFSTDIAIDSYSNMLLGDITKVDFSGDSSDWNSLKEKIEKLSIDDFYSKSSAWQDYTEQSDKKVQHLEKSALPISENNHAVKSLFGFAKSEENGARGKVIISDVYKKSDAKLEKVFSHVAIDRFTGGGIDGALYQEKVVHTDGFQIDIYIERSAFTDEKIKEAFEKSLEDLVTGQLQLGGNTTKGHGVFLGSFQLLNQSIK